MRKAVVIAVLVVLAGAGIIYAVRGAFQRPAPMKAEDVERLARTLQVRIDAIKKADIPGRTLSQSIEVPAQELAAYVIHSLKKDIPARIETLDVSLSEGTVAVDAKITFESNPTNNSLVDVLISGTHQFFAKGSLSASGGMGRFKLLDARVDGIPVPGILVETIVEKFVKPRYPNVKLDEPFTMPWGIDGLTIASGKATIVY